MFFEIINNIKGTYTIKAEGRFPERLLNVISTAGIYVSDVRHENGALIFCVSKKGYEKLGEIHIEGVFWELIKKRGLPVFLKRYRKRTVLIMLPAFFIIMTYIFSMFVWKVEIIGGSPELQKKIKPVLRENGVYTGALKKSIDLYEVKRNAIMEIDSLSWMWVDIQGTNAKVKIVARKEKPDTIKINEPSDVISLYSGVIEKMQVYCGVPLVKEGMTIEEGQLAVTGILRSENENIPTYYHHACADIILRVNNKKTFIIPKKEFKKIPTGNKKTAFCVNFKKNNVKFSLNSGISYTEYDKIEKTVKIPFMPVSFSKITYLEADVVAEDTDINKVIETHRENFLDSLEKNNMETINVSTIEEDTDSAVKVTFNAECLVKADKEIPITKGD